MSRNAIEHFEKKLKVMKAERQYYEAQWRELSEYILPEHGRFLEKSEGDKKGKVGNKILNNHAGRAVNTLTAGFMAGVTSPSRPWFRLATDDPDLARFAPVKEYLQTVRDELLKMFAQSNLYKALPPMYRELVVFGSNLLFVREDIQDGIRVYNNTIGQYYLAQNDRYVVDTAYRVIKMTIWQMVEQFGLDALSRSAKSMYENGSYARTRDVTHVIEPNDKEIEGLQDSIGNRAWRSVYYETDRDSPKLLEVSGFDEFPGMGVRWNTVADNVYGFGPGQTARGDIKELQHHELMKAEAIEKMTRPPLKSPTSLKHTPINTMPNGITYYEGPAGSQEGMTPLYQVNFPLQHVLQGIAAKERAISETFHSDLFRMITDLGRTQITAREIDERREEKLLLLGPVLNRLDDELLDPLIDRAYRIGVRQDRFPPPPGEIAGKDFRVEYISVLHQAQKAVTLENIDRLASFVGQISAASGDPTLWLKFDAPTSVDHYAESLGTPPNVVKDNERFEQEKSALIQQQQAAQALAQGQQLAETGKTLSETQTEQGTAIDRLLEGAGAQ